MDKFEQRRIIREQEKLVLNLIDSMPGIVIFKDSDGQWLRANRAALDTFQLNGIKYYGKHDSQLAEHSNNPKAMLHCIGTDKEAWDKGSTLILEEQVENTYWEVQKQPIYKETLSKKGIIVLSKDITEVKLVEQKLMDEFIEQTSSAKILFFDMGRGQV